MLIITRPDGGPGVYPSRPLLPQAMFHPSLVFLACFYLTELEAKFLQAYATRPTADAYATPLVEVSRNLTADRDEQHIDVGCLLCPYPSNYCTTC